MDSMILRTTELGPPNDYARIEDAHGHDGLSNFDRRISEGIEERLRTEKVWTAYSGWNFHGRVWWDAEGAWSCQVWCYGSPVATVRADTLENLMAEVSGEWGWD